MGGKPFTDVELALIHDRMLSHAEAARRTGRSVGTIRSSRSALGISPSRPHRNAWSDAEKAMVIANIDVSATTLARIIGRPTHGVEIMRARLRREMSA